MLRRFFTFTLSISILTILVGIGWVAYGEINISEAAHFDASMTRVTHQTESMGETFETTRAFVTSGIGQIADITTLIEEWSPRYSRAQIAFEKFDASIVAAEGRAEAYFLAQRALTEKFHSEELRTRAEAEDDAHYDLYSQWRDRAHGVRAEALSVLTRLSDMDTDLQKLKLLSEFSFDVGGFNDVPSDILSLGDELTQFQAASENIRSITDSPFASSSSN